MSLAEHAAALPYHLPEQRAEQSRDITSRWLEADPSIPARTKLLQDAYNQLFGEEEHLVSESNRTLVCVPGRAEILGSHTDGHEGLTLSGNIESNLLMLGAPRSDGIIEIASQNQDGNIVRFRIDSRDSIVSLLAAHGAPDAWANYIKSVVQSFKERGLPITGFNAVIESTIPLGAGVSSSAALEVATATLLDHFVSAHITPESFVKISRRAEHIARTPCGYLDQGTIVLADGGWLMMDHRPTPGHPFSWQRVSMDIGGYSLVVGYDPESKHELTHGEYATRKAVCQSAVPILAQLLRKKTITALRDVTVQEFYQVKNQFQTLTDVTAMHYVAHIVTENARVLAACSAIRRGDIHTFGRLMTRSGRSAISDFRLDEGAPELAFVYNTVLKHQREWGVEGVRNMGGGFCATTLALLRTDTLPTYRQALDEVYYLAYGRHYRTLAFVPAPSVGILDLAKVNAA
jgi:galactokinase